MSIISSVNISCDNCKYRVKSKADEPCVECSQAYSLKYEYDKHRHSSASEIISNISKDIKPEKAMVNKIQMTEEQARFKSVKDFCDFCFIVFGIMPKPEEIEAAQLSGYIIKSELQQKVEEAERMYDYWYSDKETNCEVVMDAMKIAIQLLKQSHPEFKK